MSKFKKTVLIADDEEDITWSISRSLQRDKKPIRVFCAHSGEETIQLLKKHSIDVLVTDLRMPGIDGYSVIQFVNDNFLRTRVIVMTAYGSSEIEQQLLKGGCFYYLEKPFEISTLKQKIYSLLENQTPEASPGGNLNTRIRQMLFLTKQTPDILLTVCQGGLEGKLYSSYGEIYHAVVGKKRGKAALKEILNWKKGFIKVQTGVKGKIRSISQGETR